MNHRFLICIAGGRVISAEGFPHFLSPQDSALPASAAGLSHSRSGAVRCGSIICLQGCLTPVAEQLVSSEYKHYHEICELRKLLALR